MENESEGIRKKKSRDDCELMRRREKRGAVSTRAKKATPAIAPFLSLIPSPRMISRHLNDFPIFCSFFSRVLETANGGQCSVKVFSFQKKKKENKNAKGLAFHAECLKLQAGKRQLLLKLDAILLAAAGMKMRGGGASSRRGIQRMRNDE